MCVVVSSLRQSDNACSDLLADRRKVHLRQSGDHVYVRGARVLEAATEESLLSILNTAHILRSQASTVRNHQLVNQSVS